MALTGNFHATLSYKNTEEEKAAYAIMRKMVKRALALDGTCTRTIFSRRSVLNTSDRYRGAWSRKRQARISERRAWTGNGALDEDNQANRRPVGVVQPWKGE